jgi:ribosomal protein S6
MIRPYEIMYILDARLEEQDQNKINERGKPTASTC